MEYMFSKHLKAVKMSASNQNEPSISSQNLTQSELFQIFIRNYPKKIYFEMGNFQSKNIEILYITHFQAQNECFLEMDQQDATLPFRPNSVKNQM